MAMRLLFMLKAPAAGQVKTRLAEDIGEVRALGAYQKMVEHLFAALASRWPIEIHYTPEDAEERMKSWLGPEFQYYSQCGGDLGERMSAAVAGSFARESDPVALLGGDCPYVTPELISRVESELKRNDAAIGPAVDGGYYLLALKRPAPEVFRRISWSTPEVLPATLEHMQKAGLKVSILETLEDVDDLPGWTRAEIWMGKRVAASE